jgi:hypothetical protein
MVTHDQQLVKIDICAAFNDLFYRQVFLVDEDRVEAAPRALNGPQPSRRASLYAENSMRSEFSLGFRS